MKKIALYVLITLSSVSNAFAADMWVSADRAERRTCPDKSCGSLGFLMFREKAVVYETQGDWARISEPHFAGCENGLSYFIKSGNAACVPENGITKGLVAEWVPYEALSLVRPKDPSEGATGYYAIVAGSDDYHIYKDLFAKTAEKLISSGKCTNEDIKNFGGWMKSTEYLESPVYFVYCESKLKKIYLNAATRETF